MCVLIYFFLKESFTYTNKNLNNEEEKELEAHAMTYPEMNKEGNLFFLAQDCPMLVSVNSIYNFLCSIMQIRAKGNTQKKSSMTVDVQKLLPEKQINS